MIPGPLEAAQRLCKSWSMDQTAKTPSTPKKKREENLGRDVVEAKV